MAGSGSSPYKYSCRKCPIRARCIEESDNSPIIKASIRNAFQNKTDTVELWAHLQVNCLLEKADREVKAAGRESLLSKRLRLTREAKQAGEAATPLPPPAPPTKELPPAPPGPQPPRPKLTPQTSFRAYPAQPPTEIRDPGQVTPQEISESRARGRKFWLTIRRSGRHILLPNDGELVLGRFDPNFGVPPDVDLTFEDSPGLSVSRRHGRIEGRGGIHTVQEMGSKLGVTVNGKKIGLGTPHRLHSGDIVALGNCAMVYDTVPPWIVGLGPNDPIEHELTVTSTGERIQIPYGREQIIGRSDRYVNFTPDIDLARLKNAANKVSRRHVRLSFMPGKTTLFIEDMGSGFGTKINGELIMLGDTRPLFPGDHIWLGGCVLAYDVRLR